MAEGALGPGRGAVEHPRQRTGLGARNGGPEIPAGAQGWWWQSGGALGQSEPAGVLPRGPWPMRHTWRQRLDFRVTKPSPKEDFLRSLKFLTSAKNSVAFFSSELLSQKLTGPRGRTPARGRLPPEPPPLPPADCLLFAPQPEGAAGPARMSLLSPPRDGRMGEWGPAWPPRRLLQVGSPLSRPVSSRL